MNDTDLTDAELLDYAIDAASYFLRSNDTQVYHGKYNGLSIEDIAMEAIVKIIEADVSPKSKTYVIEVVHNTCLNILKKKKLEVSETTKDDDGVTVTPKDRRTTELSDISNLENFVIGYLDKDDRLLYTLYAVQGLSKENIADTLGVSVRTVHRRIQELRTTIRDII